MDLPAARTLGGLLHEMAGRYGARNFVTDHRRRLTYAEFRDEARGLAKGFHALGVRRGSKVALLMGNEAEWFLVDFAVTMLGGTLVALNTWWRSAELKDALLRSDSAMLVMVDRYLRNDYADALRRIGDLRRELPELRHVVISPAGALADAIAFQDLPAQGARVSDAVLDAAIASVEPQDTAYLLFTSGSTARPKAVELVHRGLIENPHAIGERMHLSERDRLLLPTSAFWGLSCMNGLFAAMTHGASLVLLYKYDPGELLRMVEEEACTAVYTLPNIVIDLHAHPSRATRDLRSWRTGTCRPNVMHLMADMGIPEMITGYGLTEGYGHSVETDAHDPMERRMRNVGHPLRGNEIAIVDPVTHEALPNGKVGEIRLRGYVTPGYYKDPERTREAFDADGWFYTGDLGVFEEDGSLTIKGRLKEMIKTGGINVTPADVEEVLLSHPGVLQAVVCGVPDREREEIVAALVVARPGARVDGDELMRYCREQAAAYKAPRFLRFAAASDVPLTDTGKVHKARVRELLTQQYHSEARPRVASH